MTEPEPDWNDARIEACRLDLHDAQLVLDLTIEAACPKPHKFVQHRDMRPPWCAACRRTPKGLHIDRDEVRRGAKS